MSTETLNQIFQLFVIPILGILAAFVVEFLRVKSKEIINKLDNDVSKKYAEMITNTVTTCVIATNQTYVEALKKNGKFNEEAQKLAFEQTKTAVLEILTEDAKEYLTEFYGDLDKQLNSLIEAEVNRNKKNKGNSL